MSLGDHGRRDYLLHVEIRHRIVASGESAETAIESSSPSQGSLMGRLQRARPGCVGRTACQRGIAAVVGVEVQSFERSRLVAVAKASFVVGRMAVRASGVDPSIQPWKVEVASRTCKD